LLNGEAELNNIHIRRRILQLLYEVHDRDPHGAIEQDELAQRLNLPSNRVQSNLVYLSDKKLARVRRTSAGGLRVYHFAQITASGIDLLDDPSEFNERFPPQVIYQYVAGDNLQVTIGDNASEVTVGKDIIKLQFGADHSLKEVSTRFIASFEDRSDLSELGREEITLQLERLQELLQSEELDLGEVQCIKRSLIEQEGRPAVMTTALFSHPAVVKPIQQAVERLIGRS
jgi:hypothetical protein